MKTTNDPMCPCGSGKPYPACCELYIERDLLPETAEQLMRSRYSAYVLAREGYLLRTWHPTTRPAKLGLDGASPVKWLGLTVLRAHAGGGNDPAGVVEFVARYKVGGKAGRLQETSRFVREEGQWFYVDGEIAAL